MDYLRSQIISSFEPALLDPHVQVFIGDEGIGAGWGMWVVTVIAIAVVILARMMPNPEQPESVLTQHVQQH